MTFVHRTVHARISRTTFNAQPQAKAKPNRAGTKLDESLLTSKKPSADLNKSQRIATPGETIPIVFGKRLDEIGGVWVQPSLAKAGTRLFVGSFLYPISQGKIVSNPVKHRTYVGLRNLAFLPDQTITLAHDYETAEDLAAAPDVCPIGGNTLYCGIETYSTLNELIRAEVGAKFNESFRLDLYGGYRIISRGTGDTGNTAFFSTGADLVVFNSDTGADVTTQYRAWYLSEFSIDVTTVDFIFNTKQVGMNFVPLQPDEIWDVIDDNGYFPPNSSLATAISLPAGGNIVLVGEISSINTQYDPALPASTGTVIGEQRESIYTPYPDPDITPTADNSAYADITFLRVVGNIYDPPSEGSYPTTTKQLFIFYEQGVEVDLYSGGLVGGVYPKGASNQLVDLVMYLFTIYKRAAGAATADIAAPIYTGNIEDIADFCNTYTLHYNGIVDESVNIIEFASSIAPFFLLSFLSVGGQYRFEPILPLDGDNLIDETALTPAATFTEDEIIPGSFSKTFKSAADRRPIIAVMLWRESNPSAVGIQRTVQVAFTTTPSDAPVEQFDMTDFCCDPFHAETYGRYELARRQHSTHTISFQTALITTQLKPTDIIKVQRQRISSKNDDRTEIDWYQITSITCESDGTSNIQAEHFPVDVDDIAVISDEIINGSFRVLL